MCSNVAFSSALSDVRIARSASLVLIGVLVAFATPIGSAQTTYYVDDDASAGGDGVGWGSAFMYLQDALAAAGSGDEIHVAGGTYLPDHDEAGSFTLGDRGASFTLRAGVSLYGGYAGAVDPDARDPDFYISILSGDLNGDDDSGGDNSENTYYITVADNTITSAVTVDGFTFEGANANKLSGSLQVYGGGMHMDGASPSVSNCKFVWNRAFQGPGAWALGGSPTFTSCSFEGGTTFNSGYAGALYFEDANATVDGCTFTDNTSSGGGAIYAQGSSSSLTVKDSEFSGNHGGHKGGGIDAYYLDSLSISGCTFSNGNASNGGGIFVDNTTVTCIDSTFTNGISHSGSAGVGLDDCDATFINCTISHNSVTSGWSGGLGSSGPGHTVTLINCLIHDNVANQGGGGGIAAYNNLVMRNCTVVNNSCPAFGAGVTTLDANFSIVNTIIRDNASGGSRELYLYRDCTVDVSYSNIEGGQASVYVAGGCTLNWGDGNIVSDALFADPANDDYHIDPNSPCIDSGDNSAVPADTEDVDDDGDTSEQVPLDREGGPRFYDDAATADTGSGTAPIVDMGVFEFYADCNTNGIPDECDIDSGTSDDCDGDNVPDECQPDADGDGIPDVCDRCPGHDDGVDSDSDRVPDGCDVCPGEDDGADADGDGAPDACDACPGFDDSADADSDGIPDGCDGCPNDSAKTEPGLCGCGEVDDDDDGDGVPNCDDGCPDDPDKTEPGDCGCGVADTDTDGDGVLDCNDNCPDDPDKTEPGVCGCGEPDTDANDNGVPDCNEEAAGDDDGVEDGVENGAPNGGDGNSDGIPDSEQDNVASLPSSEGEYVTLAVPDGLTLADCAAIENPSPGDTPAEAEFPAGFLEFEVHGLEVGGSLELQITVDLPEGEEINTYWKYGPTPSNPTPHWYEFLFDGTTGAEISGNVITLHFVDGQRGDADLIANGVIDDPGAPAFAIPSGPPSFDDLFCECGGCACGFGAVGYVPLSVLGLAGIKLTRRRGN